MNMLFYPALIPSPEDIAVKSYNALMDFFFGSPEESMKTMAETVAEAKHADMSASWFQTIYNNVGGLAVLLSIFGLVVYIFVAIGQPSYVHRWFTAFMNVLRLLVVISLTPLVIGLFIFVVQLILQAELKLGERLAPNREWSESLTEPYAFTDIVGGGAVRLATQVGSMSIKLAITPQQMFEYLLVVLIVLAYVWSHSIDPESRLNRITWSLLLTVITAQPILVLILVIGGSFITNQEANETIKAVEIMFLTLICFVALLGIFFGMKYQVTRVIKSKMEVEGHVDVEGDINADDLEVDINEQRQSRQEGQEFMSEETVFGEVVYHPETSTTPEPESPSQSQPAEIVQSTVLKSETNEAPRDDRSKSRELLDSAAEHADKAAAVAASTGHPEVSAAIIAASRTYDFFTGGEEK